MEDYWLYNHPHFEECGIHVVGHACITARREFRDKYHASRQVLHDLLIAYGCGVGFTDEKASWAAGRSRRRSVQKLREYGLGEDEIAALLVKIRAVDEDITLIRPPRGLRDALEWAWARIRTPTVCDIYRTI